MILPALALTAVMGVGDQAPDFEADAWWNSIPLTVEKLRGRTIFVESFRTW